MKNWKKFVTAMMAVAMLTGSAASVNVYADDPKPSKVTMAAKTRHVVAGQEFKVYANTTPRDADDDYLVWKIESGSSYIRFDDDDRDDDEAEFKALRSGTAKVSCRIKGSSKKTYTTVKVSASSNSILVKGSKSVTVEAGDDFELEVKKGSKVRERDLKWTIANTSIVRFDDRDITDDEVELDARKAGTTKVTCKHIPSGVSIVYTVKVTEKQPDWDDDDDWDDDWDDDDDRDDDWDDDDDRDDDWDDDDDRDDDWDDDDDDDWDD